MTDQPQSAADRLRDLKGLHDDGLISDDEFERMRVPIVNALGAAGDPDSGNPHLSDPVSPIATNGVGDPPVPVDSTGLGAGSPVRIGPSKKELLIGFGTLSVVAVVIAIGLVVSNYQTIENWAFPEKVAYDRGVEAFHDWNDGGRIGIWSCAFLRDLRYTTDPDDGENQLAQLNRTLVSNAGLTSHGSAWDPSNSVYYVSGYWDEATRTCPDAFANPVIVGRP